MATPVLRQPALTNGMQTLIKSVFNYFHLVLSNSKVFQRIIKYFISFKVEMTKRIKDKGESINYIRILKIAGPLYLQKYNRLPRRHRRDFFKTY